MNKIITTFVFLFAVIFYISLGSASLSLYGTEGYFYSVQDLKLSPSLTRDKIVEFCSEESCIIEYKDYNEARITILSHYDHAILLTLDGSGKDVNLFWERPYYINETLKKAMPKEPTTKKTNWTEVIITDLTYLMNEGVLDITESDISDMLSSCNSKVYTDSLHGWTLGKNGWMCGYNTITKNGGWYPGDGGAQVDTEFNKNQTTPTPVFLKKEFTLNKTPNTNNLIYWIFALAVILAVLIIFFLKKYADLKK